MLDRGKLVILVIFGLALGLGGYAWWHHFQQGRHSRAFWGSRSAVLIRYAPRVELLRLADSGQLEGTATDSESLRIGGQTALIHQRADISRVRGLVHARHTLVQDASFDLQSSRQPTTGRWEFALRFSREGDTATVAFAPDENRISLVEADRETSLAPPVMRTFAAKSVQWFREGLVPSAGEP